MRLTEVVRDYLINNDPVKANLKANESITGKLTEILEPIYNPKDKKYFRVKVSQTLSSVRRMYSDPREEICFYYRKVKNKYEVISQDEKYRDDVAEQAILEFKPHFVALQQKLELQGLIAREDRRLFNHFMAKVELKWGTAKLIE